MPAASSSASVKKRIDSTPSRTFRQSSSAVRAPGKRPATATTAIASPSPSAGRGRAPARSGAAAGARPSAAGTSARSAWASDRMVGCWKSRTMGSRRPSTASSRACTRASSSEWPPASKKLCWTLTRSRPIASHQIAARVRSSSSRGGSKEPSAAAPRRSGGGRALRSSLPVAESGQLARSTNADGTMYSGSFTCAKRRSSAAGGPGSAAGMT